VSISLFLLPPRTITITTSMVRLLSIKGRGTNFGSDLRVGMCRGDGSCNRILMHAQCIAVVFYVYADTAMRFSQPSRCLRCHPTRPGVDVQDIRRNPRMVRDEPFCRCLGLFTIISRIEERRIIWMQEAFNFDPITRNTKHVLVLRLLMMHTHLFRPQHHQSKLSGRIVHV
jgi:hypothetical protein